MTSRSHDDLGRETLQGFPRGRAERCRNVVGPYRRRAEHGANGRARDRQQASAPGVPDGEKAAARQNHFHSPGRGRALVSRMPRSSSSRSTGLAERPADDIARQRRGPDAGVHSLQERVPRSPSDEARQRSRIPPPVAAIPRRSWRQIFSAADDLGRAGQENALRLGANGQVARQRPDCNRAGSHTVEDSRQRGGAGPGPGRKSVPDTALPEADLHLVVGANAVESPWCDGERNGGARSRPPEPSSPSQNPRPRGSEGAHRVTVSTDRP